MTKTVAPYLKVKKKNAVSMWKLVVINTQKNKK